LIEARPETSTTFGQGGLRHVSPSSRPLQSRDLTSSALPVKPNWLSAAGELIWDDNIARAATIGITAHDTVVFAIFCNLTGEIAQAMRSGKMVSIAAQTEVRRVAELLGLAGPDTGLSKLNVDRDASSVRRFSGGSRRAKSAETQECYACY
jgi:hypothetical protein